MEIKNKLIKNTLFNFIVRLWNILLSFLLFPFIVIHIGKHAAAVWILLSSINAYFQIFDIAFSVSLIKYTSEFYAKKEFDKINEYINTSFIIFAVSGIVVFFCLLILKIFVNDLFHIPLELQEETGTVIMITAVFTLFIIPFSVFRNVIVGLQRFDITSHVDFYISSLQLIFTVFFLIKGFGLTSLIIINSSAAAISIIIFMIYVK
ncbi:MAG: MATE family efflux transporter, partial [bacterium]|nr:MATE family efflux transporter [bacterium]